jgi:hypothetical protein
MYFMYESLFGNFFYLHVNGEKLLERYEKCTHKMLMKLTPGQPPLLPPPTFYVAKNGN